jgi:hypothetical protein
MGLRDLRAGTTAVIGDSCPASEIDILIADITEIISSKLAEGSNIESTIVQALQKKKPDPDAGKQKAICSRKDDMFVDAPKKKASVATQRLLTNR